MKRGWKMEYGKTLKKIRLSKGMTLEETTKGVISIAQLSRFENGKSMLTVDILYELLNNLSTTHQEYFFLMGVDTEKELKTFFSKIITEKGTFLSDEQLKKEQNDIENQRDNSYWKTFELTFIDSIMRVRNKQPLNENPDLIDELMQVDEWGERELRLYAMLGFTLPVEKSYFLMKTAIKRSEQYQAIPQDMKLLHTILTNNISSFLFHNRLDYAEDTLSLFEESLSNKVEFVESYLNFLFSKGMIAFKKNNIEEAKINCKQAISLCEIFNLKKRKKSFDGRYEMWNKHYANPEFTDLVIEPGILGFIFD